MKAREDRVGFLKRLTFGAEVSLALSLIIIITKQFFFPVEMSLLFIFFLWVISSICSALATYIPEIGFKDIKKHP
jgi:ABC-type lipoprotein release transport system permease subunit